MHDGSARHAVFVGRNSLLGVHVRDLASGLGIGDDEDAPMKRPSDASGREWLHSQKATPGLSLLRSRFAAPRLVSKQQLRGVVPGIGSAYGHQE